MRILCRHNLILLLTLILAFIALLYRADKPFWGHHDFNNAFFGNIARNTLRYGVVVTRFGQVVNSGIVTPSEFSYHTHHPGLLITLLTLSYYFFGITEISTRLVPIILSVLTVLLLYVIVKKLYSPAVAALAAVFWIITPLYLYFGKMAVHEIPVLFFFLFSLWRYLAWNEGNSRRNFVWLIIGIILGCLSGWPGYYTPVSLLVYHFLLHRKFEKKLVWLIIVPLGLFLAHVSQTFILSGSFTGGGFNSAFALRSSRPDFLAFLKLETTYILLYFTKPLVLISLAGLLLFFAKRTYQFPLMLLLFGSLHPLLFEEAANRHDYLIYYLLPFISVTAGFFISRMLLKSRPAGAFFAVAVIALSVIQSSKYTATLLNGDRFKDGVVIGRYIKENSAISDRVLLLLKKPNMEFEGWHTTFYSDRNISVIKGGVISSDEKLSAYDEIVTYLPNGSLTLIRN